MRILIVAPAWVGDMVMAHSLVRLLQRTPGGARATGGAPPVIDLIAPPATAALGSRMPGIGSTHVLDVGHGELGLGRRRKAARSLAGAGYDQAIVLPNSFKSALVPWLARIPRRTGWTGESRMFVLNDRRRLDPERYPLMIERFMALGLESGAPLERPYPLPELRADPERTAHLRAAFSLADAGVTVLCPGAEFGPAKRWPARHFAEVARHETARGRQVWLLGSPGDGPVCAEIEAGSGAGVVNLAGRTSLVDALDLIASAQRVVCNDSGLMHVAGALGVPVVALFGSTSPGFTPPLGAGARVLENDLPCRPCFRRECPLGHLNCLEELAAARVIEVLEGTPA